MLRITGYSDKYSVCPGDTIKFYVNSEKNESYDSHIVRLIHGDTNPEGPGYKEEEISASCNTTYDGRNQRRFSATGFSYKTKGLAFSDAEIDPVNS